MEGYFHMKKSEKVFFHQREGKLHIGNGIKLFVLTLIFLLCTVSMTHIIKLVLKSKNNAPVITNEISIPVNLNMNPIENEIFSMILANEVVIPNYDRKDNKLHNIYIQVLARQLSSNQIDLGELQLENVKGLISQLNNTISNDDRNNTNNMSFISKCVISSVAQNIYEQCGLTLDYNLDGEIQQVKDTNGNIMYEISKNKVNSGVQWNLLFAVILICFILISICIIISKRNQLFKKGGFYHGFKENEFA